MDVQFYRPIVLLPIVHFYTILYVKMYSIGLHVKCGVLLWFLSMLNIFSRFKVKMKIGFYFVDTVLLHISYHNVFEERTGICDFAKWDSGSSFGAEYKLKTLSQPFGVTLRGVSGLRVLAALLPCYNDRNGRRPFKYQINSKLNFLAVQATLRITCNYPWQTLVTLLSCHFAPNTHSLDLHTPQLLIIIN